MVVRADVFHIGMPRAGSTTLQSVLRSDPRVHMVQSRSYWGTAWWDDHLEEPAPEALVRVESAESLVRQAETSRGKFVLTLERIASVVPKARIVLVIREQRSFLLSRYKFEILRGYGGSLEAWLTGAIGLDFVSAASYGAMHAAICAFFPPEQVHFLMFEDLAADYHGFFEQVYAVLGIPSPDDLQPTVRNPSRPDRDMVALRKLNRLRGGNARESVGTPANRRFTKAAHRLAPLLAASDARIEWGDSRLLAAMEVDFRRHNAMLADRGAVTIDRLRDAGYLT